MCPFRLQDVQLSSNGLIAISPDASTFEPGRDYFGYLPSINKPNGIVAAFWDDLWCRSSRGCRLLTGQRTVQPVVLPQCGTGNASIIQFSHFEHRYDASAIASVEARLYADGCIELQYQHWPSRSKRMNAKMGIESKTGVGVNHAAVFPFDLGRPFGVMLVPFFASDSATCLGAETKSTVFVSSW